MDELNIPFIALEGAAYAGKTTLLNYLKTNHKDKLITIPEASEFVGGDKNFPDVPFKTIDDAKASTHFFLELEKNRIKLAKKIFSRTGLPVILDRTTPVSSLIFYQLLRYTTPDQAEFIDSFYKHAISVFNAETLSGSLIIPGNIIYIRPKNQNVFESRLGRGTKNTVFSSWNSFLFLDDKYSKFISKYYPNNSIILNSENTVQSLIEQSEKSLSLISSAKDIRHRTIFENFLGEDILPYKISLDAEYKKYSNSIERCRELINNNQIKYDW